MAGQIPFTVAVSILLLLALATSGRARGIAEMEARLTRLERKVNLILAHLGIEDDVPQGGVEELILQGKKIQAIKLYREYNQVGLKEAKDAVEEMAAGLRAGTRS